MVLTEIMTKNDIIAEKKSLSVLTVAFLKDTGFWSDVNENLAEEMYWGRNKGCTFTD